MRITQDRALLFGIGLLVLSGPTTGCAFAAPPEGGSYAIASGLLLVGGISALRDLYYQIKYVDPSVEGLVLKRVCI